MEAHNARSVAAILLPVLIAIKIRKAVEHYTVGQHLRTAVVSININTAQATVSPSVVTVPSFISVYVIVIALILLASGALLCALRLGRNEVNIIVLRVAHSSSHEPCQSVGKKLLHHDLLKSFMPCLQNLSQRSFQRQELFL